MGRSYSALRAAHEKKAARAAKAAGVKPKKRFVIVPLEEKESLRPSTTPAPSTPPVEKSQPASRNITPEPKSPELESPAALRSARISSARKMEVAAIQKIKDEHYADISSERSLSSSTTPAATEVTENVEETADPVNEAATEATHEIEDEPSLESPLEAAVPSPMTSSASAPKTLRSGRALRSSTISTPARGNSQEADTQNPEEEQSADMVSSSGKSKKPRSGITSRSSTPAASTTSTKKVKKEVTDAPYQGPVRRSSATSSAGNPEPSSAPTRRRSSRLQAILKVKEELSAETAPNPVAESNTVAAAPVSENEPASATEPESQPQAQREVETHEEPEQEAEPEVEPEHEEAQGTTAGHHYGDHHNCPQCEVWGWEYPPLHISEEDEDTETYLLETLE